MKLKFLTGALALGLVCMAQQPPPPDNPKTNERDRNQTAKTADQAKDNAADRELMQKIRKAVVDDKTLSMDGHNVKIIAEHGRVTLKGQVPSAGEKKSIEQKAIEAAGAGNVTNQLTIKPGK